MTWKCQALRSLGAGGAVCRRTGVFDGPHAVLWDPMTRWWPRGPRRGRHRFVNTIDSTLTSDTGSSGETAAQGRATCASSGFHGPRRDALTVSRHRVTGASLSVPLSVRLPEQAAGYLEAAPWQSSLWEGRSDTAPGAGRKRRALARTSASSPVRRG